MWSRPSVSLPLVLEVLTRMQAVSASRIENPMLPITFYFIYHHLGTSEPWPTRSTAFKIDISFVGETRTGGD